MINLFLTKKILNLSLESFTVQITAFLHIYEFVTLESENSAELMERKAVKFTPEWCPSFSVLAQRTWTNIPISDSIGQVTVSYLDSGLTPRQVKEFRTFLINREYTRVAAWLTEVISHLTTDTLTEEWLDRQDLYINLKFICGIKITTILNFPCQGLTVSSDNYPLAFILASAE